LPTAKRRKELVMQLARRAILLPEIRRLIDAARSERAMLPMASPQRQFYLGVEAAADEVVHPELGAIGSADRIAGRPPAFREGYLRASSLLAAAATAAEPPQHLPLPEAPSSA
jgi:hypothetical protein